MKKSYRMIKAFSQASFMEKKSEFISHVMPVISEEEAIQFINQTKKKYYDASHNCFAYIIGEDQMIQRSSDAGEPSGTAGVPMLEVLRKEDLTNIVVIVTRYFGGILLGAGGLIRAYTEGAALAIKSAAKQIVKPFEVFDVSIDYTYLGKIQHEIPKKGYTLFDTQFSENVLMTILAEPESRKNFTSDIMEWTGGSAIIEHKGQKMIKIDEN